MDLWSPWEWFSLYAALNFESIHQEHMAVHPVSLRNNVTKKISDSFSDEVLLEEDEEEEEVDENMEDYKPLEPPPQVRPIFQFYTIGSSNCKYW